MQQILLIGLTSSRPGNMESTNLGNYIIAEPLFQELRRVFPDARIATSIQMSDEFNERFNLVGLRDTRFWRYGRRTRWTTRRDWVLALLWKITRLRLFLSTRLLAELSRADLVIDFSGDVYGDNADAKAFHETNSRLRLARLLNKKTAMIIGSPGPFTDAKRFRTAQNILPKLDLLTNREPLSTMMLSYAGITNPNMHSVACPSVLFAAAPQESLPRNRDYTRIFEDSRPIFGMILCGWNMPVGPYNRWPREDWEFENFIMLIRHLLSTTSHRICLMSHQNATTPAKGLTKGNDHRLIERLIALLGSDYDNDRVFTLEALYSASESKTLIGGFDVLLSGRVHGAVQGLSQAIPTAIIDYGHEPKAHKLQGFARTYGIDNYVVDPLSPEALTRCADALLKNKAQLRIHLNDKIPEIRSAAQMNFNLVKQLAEKP